ncbi:Cof-type HAD-IIB family hydrolase [Scytonema sp. UIC 10036]|uniref:Cof-type HAD-IIB family hydrolase n=1 Tax=Scytonema sp. UIC 10036 TaxID=2304196 RepID=UPI0012DA426D|nr:Cof-type HAD-IIB family hydrolase [Scytonema sp. UIC 10036]MUG92395.1 Cof-type HAD-IIB family hydrolase [Scytonema sp. UIC 10036]
MKKAMTTTTYQLAAIDLDDTLLGPDKQISSENRAAVQLLRNLGMRVVLASGRKHQNILQFHQQLGLRGLIVSSHGALVKDAETGTILQQQLVPANLARQVMADGLAYGLTLICYYSDGVRVSEKNVWTDLYQKRTGEAVTEDSNLVQNLHEAPQKIIWSGDPERISELHQAAKASYQEHLNIIPTDPENLDFTALEVNKAVGVAAVAQHYGVKPSEVIAFGDGNNDVPLLSWAGLGIAMSHACPSAKKSAVFVASPGNPETSFARAVAMALASS